MVTLEATGRGVEGNFNYNANDELVTQVFNGDTGHWTLRDKRNGRYIVGGEKPFEGVRIRRVGTEMPHPAISRELALKAEKAVTDVMNKSTD